LYKLCYVELLGAPPCAPKAAEAAPSTASNTANTAIGLLRAVAFHIDEIKFGCLKGLESDIREWAAQQQ
jgi:hypothetical protein